MLQKSDAPAIILIPGLGDSGPQHWQSIWEKEHPEYLRVQQKNWDEPVCSDWITELDRFLQPYGSNAVLVAHSLGCIALVHWVKTFNRKIKGALLVAPPDVEAAGFHPEATGFSPVPLEKLPFPSIVVTSNDDMYISLEKGRFFAESWGSTFKNAGNAGHLNSASNLGSWEEGKEFLNALINQCLFHSNK